MPILVLIRGLPGVGKTTSAKELKAVQELNGRNVIRVSADDFMLGRNGKYEFMPVRLSSCHAACQRVVETAMNLNADMVIVDNTFSQRWEMVAYFDLAKLFKYQLEIRTVSSDDLTDEELAARNTHGVPVEGIANMRARWENL